MLFGKFNKSKSQLGVDIGSSNIKIVQLRPENDKFVLETYGLVNFSYQIASKDGSNGIVQTAIIDNYVKVFELAGLEPQALEIESLSLIRSLIEDANTNLMIDMGAKTTSLNLVDGGYLRLSKSLNVGGDTMTNSIAQSLS